jgi:hypothetical protein
MIPERMKMKGKSDEGWNSREGRSRTTTESNRTRRKSKRRTQYFENRRG